MKIKIFFDSILTGLLLAIALGVSTSRAAPQYFSDAGGPLPWTTTATDWGNASGGPYNVAWTANNNAIFQGTAGTVNVNTVSASSLTFTVAGYTLAGSTITLTASANITNTANATISSVLAGAATGLNLSGAATLTLAGQNTYAGSTTTTAGTLERWTWAALARRLIIYPEAAWWITSARAVRQC